jgi:hypothetical protein
MEGSYFESIRAREIRMKKCPEDYRAVGIDRLSSTHKIGSVAAGGNGDA